MRPWHPGQGDLASRHAAQRAHVGGCRRQRPTQHGRVPGAADHGHAFPTSLQGLPDLLAHVRLTPGLAIAHDRRPDP